MPYPATKIFACGVFQTLHIIQKTVIETLVNRSKGCRDVAVVEDPTSLRINGPSYMDFNTYRVPMETSAFVPWRRLWESVGHFNHEFLKNVHVLSASDG
ncbi:MAG TPA: hypothetical protein VG675_13065 [Bryobacteraceae bacterium]|nr:hypothetical protein [Bryobacteraceae bacterium]